MLALVTEYFRKQGIQIFIYLDDILIVGKSHQEVEWVIQTAVIQALTQAGFIINLTKSGVTQSQDLVYIGGRFQMDIGFVFHPELVKVVLISCVLLLCYAGTYKPARQNLMLLDLAAMLSVIRYVHIHMQLIQ